MKPANIIDVYLSDHNVLSHIHFFILLIFLQKTIFQQKSLSVVQPKPPQGFKDYLLVNCSYVLHGNSASTLSVPMVCKLTCYK